MTTVNQFIKQMKNLFSDIEYRATSKDGIVFKSQGWDKVNKILTEYYTTKGENYECIE